MTRRPVVAPAIVGPLLTSPPGGSPVIGCDIMKAEAELKLEKSLTLETIFS